MADQRSEPDDHRVDRPRCRSQPDPRIEHVIRALSGISAKVDQLADQIEALKKGKG